MREKALSCVPLALCNCGQELDSMMATRFLTLRVAPAGGLDFRDVSRFFFLGDCGLSGCCRMVSSLG